MRYAVLGAIGGLLVGLPALAQEYEKLYRQARDEWKQGRYEEAASALERSTKDVANFGLVQWPTRRDIWLTYAELQLLLGATPKENTALELTTSAFENGQKAGDDAQTLARAATLRAQAQLARGELNAAGGLLEEALRGAPDAFDAQVTLADLRRMQQRWPEAEALVKKALAAASGEVLAKERPEAMGLASLVAGRLEYDRERFGEARPHLTKAMETLGRLPQFTLAQTQARAALALLALAEGRTEEALPLLEAANRPCGRLKTSPACLAALHAAARVAIAQGDLTAARPRVDEELQTRERLAPKHPATASALEFAGVLAMEEGRHSDARNALERALQLRRDLLGGEHLSTARTLRHLGTAQHRLGRSAEARQRLAEALKLETAALGADSLAATETNLAEAAVLSGMGQPEEAATLYRQALDNLKKRFPGNHPRRAAAQVAFASTLLARGQDDEAETLLEEWAKEHPTPRHAGWLQGTMALAEANLARRRYPVAEGRFRAVLEARPNLALPRANRGLAEALYYQQRFADAIPYYEKALPQLAASADTAFCWQHLGDAYARTRQTEKSIGPYEQSLALRRKLLPAGHAEIAANLLTLGLALFDTNHELESDRYMAEWLALRKKDPNPYSPIEYPLLEGLSQKLVAAKQYAQAEPYLREVLSVVDRPGARGAQLDLVLRQLGDACAAQDKRVPAAEFYERRARRDLVLRRFADAEEVLTLAAHLRSQAEGGRSPKLAATRLTLARVYQAQRKAEQARQQYEMARDASRAASDNVRLAGALNGLGQLAFEKQDLEGAKALYEQAAGLLQQELNPPKDLTALLACNRGRLLAVNPDREKEAAPLFEQALKDAESAFSPDGPPPLDVIEEVARFYEMRPPFGNAEQVYARSMELRRSTYGDSSVEYAQGLLVMGEYLQTKRPADAAGLVDKALPVFQRLQGAESEAFATTLLRAAPVYAQAQQADKASELSARAFSIRKATNATFAKEDHAFLVDVANHYRKAGSYKDTLEIWKTLEAIWKPAGMEEPKYRTALRELSVAYLDSGDLTQAQTYLEQARGAARTAGRGDTRPEAAVVEQYLASLRRAAGKNKALAPQVRKLEGELRKLKPKA